MATRAGSGPEPKRVGLLLDPEFARGGGGGAAPSTMLLGHCLSTPSPPAALSAAQAGTWTDPTRVGLRPDPDFARLGVAAPSPTLLGPYLTMPLPTGRGRRAFERGRGPASGRNPPEWAPGPTRASPGKEGLRRLARRRAGQAASGPEPTRVGSRPDPGLDRLGGAEHSPASHGPCTATPSARPRPIPSPTLRPTRHRGRSRPGRSPGLARARGPRPRSRSIVRLYAASVPGPLLNPPPPCNRGWGGLLRYTAPAALTVGPTDSSPLRRPSVHTLLDCACRRARLFSPLCRSLAQHSCTRFAVGPPTGGPDRSTPERTIWGTSDFSLFH